MHERLDHAARVLNRAQAVVRDSENRALLLELALVCGWAGEAACARGNLERSGSTLKPWTVPFERFAHAGLAHAEGNDQHAMRILRETRNPNCYACELPLVGRLFEEMGQPDSAIVAYEGYIATPSMDRIYTDVMLAPMHERLGSYYDERGDPDAAARHYARFVALWSRADPSLQPRVTAARQKLQRLQSDR